MGKTSFIKTIENFKCEVCGQEITGNGYTDHCPQCLSGKHVDISPGDRQAQCQGLMIPIGAIQKSDQWQIVYKCQKCGVQKLNKVQKDDNLGKIIELSANPIVLDDSIAS